MIMMLPFLVAALSIGFAIFGRRPASLWAWLATLVIYLAWLQYHITDSLPLSF
ncbi:MAG: DUF5993 family protein [Pigmentiphaga sp.]